MVHFTRYTLRVSGRKLALKKMNYLNVLLNTFVEYDRKLGVVKGGHCITENHGVGGSIPPLGTIYLVVNNRKNCPMG